MKCVLGQIDPGPIEFDIVEAETKDYARLAPREDRPPPSYWEEWRLELEFADLIVVNSEWSANLLLKQNVEPSKLKIIPLAYEGSAKVFKNSTLNSKKITLTVLFLGQVILRKGVGQLFDAIRLLEGKPINFVLAGPVGMQIPSDIAIKTNVKILGRVDRLTAGKLYETADVFILPTLSDGFAITQLEALAHGLPVIASRSCGTVVNHGVNGLLLDEVTGAEIARRLTAFLDPDLLLGCTAEAYLPERFKFSNLAGKLVELVVD
jgi:glycosyltransferase involved in cell wall biosynthesis